MYTAGQWNQLQNFGKRFRYSLTPSVALKIENYYKNSQLKQ